MNFGDILRKLIEEFDLTQKEVAKDLNIAPSTLGGYVQNASEPDFDTLKELALYFDVTTDYLLGFHVQKENGISEIEILRVFRSLTAYQQEVYLEQGKAFSKIKRTKPKIQPKK